MTDKQTYTWLDWTFIWLWWVILNAAGWSISQASGTIGLLLVGVVIGFAQRLVLRNFIQKTRIWVIATAIVLGISLPMSMFFFYMRSAEQAVPVGAVTGAVVGFTQRLVLYKHTPDARWWTPTSIVGLSLGMYLGMTIFYDVYGGIGSVLSNALIGIVIGSTYGAVTGIALIWLLRNMPDQEEETPIEGC